jgi:hypothetical protein
VILAPILPSLAILNAAGQILNKVSAWLARATNIAGSAWSADITRSARATNVSRPITRPARSTNVAGPIARCARSANIAWSIAWLSWATNIARPTAAWLSWAAKVGSTAWTSGQLGGNVASAWTASGTRELAGTIAEKLSGSAASKCTAGTCDRTGTET